MKLWILCFISLFVWVSSHQHESFGYCQSSDTACMNAWLQCHGEKPKGEGWLLLRVFWLGKLTIFDSCLKENGERPIGASNTDEDPDGGAPPAHIWSNTPAESSSQFGNSRTSSQPETLGSGSQPGLPGILQRPGSSGSSSQSESSSQFGNSRTSSQPETLGSGSQPGLPGILQRPGSSGSSSQSGTFGSSSQFGNAGTSSQSGIFTSSSHHGTSETSTRSGIPGSSSQPGGLSSDEYRFMGVIARRISEISDPSVADNVKCCYAKGCEFIDQNQQLVPNTFISLINQRFYNQSEIRDAHLSAVDSCKNEPIRNCSLIPFRDCMYKSCIERIMKKPRQ